MNAKRCPTSDELRQFVSGKLVLKLHDAVEQHVDRCIACQETVEILDERSGTLLTGLGQAADDVEAGDDAGLRRLVEKAKALGGQVQGVADAAAIDGDWHAGVEFARGTELGNYVLDEAVGGGNMGFVFRAFHRRMKRDVALKFISPYLMRSPEARKRFQREIEAAARLNHANIVAAYDADEVNGYHFLVMELIEGSDLRAVVKRDGPLAIDRALRYLLDAARGIAFAHGVGIIHRDVKPSNLILDRQGVVKVLDLGLARLERLAEESQGTEVTRSGGLAGTPAFMAPEQCSDMRQTDHRSDVYSLGCTLYYLLTATTVFSDKTTLGMLMAHANQPAPSICDARPDCPVEIDQLFRSLVSKRPQDRPPSMQEVVATIEALLAKYEQNELAVGPRVVARPRRTVWFTAACGASLLATAALLGIFGPAWFSDAGGQKPAGADRTPGDDQRPTPVAVVPADDKTPLMSPAAGLDDTGDAVEPAVVELVPPAQPPPQIELVRIEPGTFAMGSPADDEAARDDEQPRHDVEISKPFLMGKFEVTVAQFTDVMGPVDKPALSPPDQSSAESSNETGRMPIAGISWLEAIEFCNKLSERHGFEPYYEVDDKTVSIRRGSNGFRLPTEAEWEFACRANSPARWHFGDDAEKLDRFAWFAENSGGRAQPVGGKKPNAFGLHDMHGNVPEWCWDRYDPQYYGEAEAIDPPGSSRGERRVFRGGGVTHRAEQTRSAARNPLGMTYGFLNNVGLRVARSAE